MKKLVLAACMLSLAAGLSFGAQAKSQSKEQSRTGLGYNTQLSRNISSLAVRHWSGTGLGLEGIFGFGFGNDTTLFNVGGKILGTIKKESNMRVYGYGLLGLEYASFDMGDDTESETDVVFGAGFGVEFFLSGLPNLGFGVETGIGYDGGSEVFSTTSATTSVGVKYYF